MDFSSFNFKKDVFATLKESIRRNSKFISMITVHKAVKSNYDKRKDFQDYDTMPVVVGR